MAKVARFKLTGEQAGQSLVIKHEVSSSSAALRMAAAGLGFTLTDSIALDTSMHENLVTVPWTPSIKEKLGYFLSETPTPHGSRDAFLECLREVSASL